MLIDLSKLSTKTTVQELQSLNKILKEAKPQVSFWGTRYISYQIQEINLRDLADKVSPITRLAGQENLDAQERLLWVKISNKITKFYDETDKAGKEKCFITRIIIFLRECSCFFLYTPDFYHREGVVADDFCRYSKFQLEANNGILARLAEIEFTKAKDYFIKKDLIKVFLVNNLNGGK